MTKQEFKEWCHNQFINRGFVYKKKSYYLKGAEIVCNINLQKSMAEAYYVNYYFFLNCFDEDDYPTKSKADIRMRIPVLSKDTYIGEHFMDACIEYELYTETEIKKYFDEEFDNHILPIIEGGKKALKKDIEYFLDEMFEEEIENIMNKLQGC